MNKTSERLQYLLLLANVFLVNALASLCYHFSFLFSTFRTKDVAFYPYVPQDNPGAIVRFQQFLTYFDEDKISYHGFFPCESTVNLEIFSSKDNLAEQYQIYKKVYWTRLKQVLQIRNYKNAYVQRGFFPFYPDQKFPYLERLANKLNKSTTIDFYDSDYVHNETLVNQTVQYFQKVTVVNDHLKSYFQQIHSDVSVLPIALDPDPYAIKQDYSIDNETTIFWSGNSENSKNLQHIKSTLEAVSKLHPIKIVAFCPEAPNMGSLKVEHHVWQKSNFYELLSQADIAIYPPGNNNETSKGKMALKVLEYMAAGLPIVGSAVGVTPFLKNKESILFVNSDEEWQMALLELIKDQSLRMKLGMQANKALEENHHPAKIYKSLKDRIIA